jgi:hypothetical protein
MNVWVYMCVYVCMYMYMYVLSACSDMLNCEEMNRPCINDEVFEWRKICKEGQSHVHGVILSNYNTGIGVLL